MVAGKDWLGDKWIAPNGINLVPKETYTIYNEANFSSSTGASLSAQTVTPLIKSRRLVAGQDQYG